jgi:SPP1 gp7 family putative phage head morphogenesis protein
MPSILTEPVPNEVAAAFVSTKQPMLRKTFDQLLPELKARAICVTGLEDLSAVQRVRDAIAEVPMGADWETSKDQIMQELSFMVTSSDPDEMAAQIAAAEARAELLLRTHGFQAYAAANYQALDEQRDVFPYWEYVSTRDDRVRDSHAALNGLIIPCDSPFWVDHFPPWDWGCRCEVRPRTAAEAGEIAAEGKRQINPEDPNAVVTPQRVADAHVVKMLEKGQLQENGRTLDIRAPLNQGKPNAYTWKPGDLRLPLDKIMTRYDDQTARDFSNFAQRTKLPDETTGSARSLWDWLYQPLLQADATATIAAGKTEIAILRDYDTALPLPPITGDATRVMLADTIASARRDGRRLSVEHNHPDAPDAVPSPRDVATMLANPDVLYSIGTSAGYNRTIFDRTILRPGDPLSKAGIKRLLEHIRAMQKPNGELAVPRQVWLTMLKNLQQIQGAIRYDNPEA